MSSPERLLENDGIVSVHEQNLHVLKIEMLEVHKRTSSPRMNDLFEVRDKLYYNLRSNSHFVTPSIKAISHGMSNLPQHNIRTINDFGKVKASKNVLSESAKIISEIFYIEKFFRITF